MVARSFRESGLIKQNFMSDRQPHKVLYFYTAESPFVAKDIEILKTRFEVIRFRFDIYRKRRLLLTLTRQAFFLLRHILFCRMTVTQFAGLHSLLPVLFTRLFGKKSVIVAGGTDCVAFPSINYGNFSAEPLARITRFSFRNASLILPVHESLVLYDYSYQKNDHPRQGIKYFIPDLKTRIITIYNGYDSHYWRNTAVQKEPRSFITILAYVNSRFTLTLKGIDLFIALSRQFPDASFSIVGGEELRQMDLPPNLKLLPNIWGEKLVGVLSEKQFYVQLSMSEGFPNALSEAMLCECVPIVSKVGGMPDIVSDCGYILEEKDTERLNQLVSEALSNPNSRELGLRARNRIRNTYTFEKRANAFTSAVSGLLGS
jgi:glycosyltransferase involved in cell wall biosynthesis